MKKRFFHISNYNLKYFYSNNNLKLENLLFGYSINLNLFDGFKKSRLEHCITAIFNNIFEQTLTNREFHYLLFYSRKYLNNFKLSDDIFYDKYLSSLYCKLLCSNKFHERFDFFVNNYIINLSDFKAKDLILLIVDFYLVINQK